MVFFIRKTVETDKMIPESTKDDYAEIRNLFKRCDANQDGRLSVEEVKAGFGALGSHLPAFRAQRAFLKADKNGDGYIDNEELDELVQYAMKSYNYKA